VEIIGLDISTTTGWCLYEGMGRGVPPRITCGLWELSSDDLGEKCAALGLALGSLCKGHPNLRYAAIEAPLQTLSPVRKATGDLAGEHFAGVTTARTLASSNALVGAAEGVLGAHLVPCRRVASASWRKGFIGTSFAPKHLKRDEGRKWLKNEARFYADKISRQYGEFHIPNSRDRDAAEAVGIAIWLRGHVLHFIEEDKLKARLAA
jgi:hypothetical protein